MSLSIDTDYVQAVLSKLTYDDILYNWTPVCEELLVECGFGESEGDPTHTWRKINKIKGGSDECLVFYGVLVRWELWGIRPEPRPFEISPR